MLPLVSRPSFKKKEKIAPAVSVVNVYENVSSLGDRKMSTATLKRKRGKAKRSAKFSQAVLGKPSGIIQPRVQEVGPQHFGVVSIDCGKARSKWLLADFFGNVLIPPTEVEHRATNFKLMVSSIRSAIERHQLKDIVVCVEMTGTYHKPVFRAMKKAGFETRLVHPFASSHYRLAQHGDVKTDDNDLAAIFRAAVNGFGLIQKEVPAIYSELQILCRHRRDLVQKKSKLQSQIRHHLQQCLPGFCDLFEGDKLWQQTTPIPLLKALAARGGTAHQLVQAGFEGVCQWFIDAGIKFRKPAVERVILWAADAASHDAMAPTHTLVWQSLIDDWTSKKSQITELEIKIANVLVQTPYILLLSHPGINVVSAAELAGELGPIENYASAKAISGRAGLFPSRYQSDGVDRGGKLSRFRNGRLRAAWMLVADNMIKCNQYWQLKSANWRTQGHDPRDIRCRIANRMTRVVFQMISGKKLFSHPSQLSRGYVLEKLMVFLQGHGVPPHLIVRDLDLAAKQVPQSAWTDEAKPLQRAHEKSKRSRRANPASLGSLLVAVLAKLGIGGEDDDSVES